MEIKDDRIELTNTDIHIAIHNYLTRCGMQIRGPWVFKSNGETCLEGAVHINPKKSTIERFEHDFMGEVYWR